jgi:hypothetical protein
MAARKAASPPARRKKLANREVALRLANRGGEIAAALSVGNSIRGGRSAGPAAHRYQAGQTVTLAPNRYGANRNGRFEVTRLLPEEHGVNHYRLKSVADGHERVAREDELI